MALAGLRSSKYACILPLVLTDAPSFKLVLIIFVIQFAGLAPGPFAGLVLADNGASVIRVDRSSAPSFDLLCRGKQSIIVNSKTTAGRELLKGMLAKADVVIDPFRPGVMERMGLGPEVFLGGEGREGLNERLVYARIVGFPRTGPHKDMAGHDINYVALSGVLSMLPGANGKPSVPLNILGDFAGGGAMCALGILLALLARGVSGKGQVVNADMVTGLRYLSTFPLVYSLTDSPMIGVPSGTNILDGGAPFYSLYICKDGGLMSVGCLEPHFYQVFFQLFLKSVPEDLALEDGWRPSFGGQMKTEEWGRLREFFEKGFLTRTREFWTGVYHGTQACVVPVLTPKEAAKAAGEAVHPQTHPLVRNMSGDLTQLSRAAKRTNESLTLRPGKDTDLILEQLGLDKEARRKLLEAGALGNGPKLAKL